MSGARELTANTGMRTLSPKKPVEPTMTVRIMKMLLRKSKSRTRRKVMVSHSLASQLQLFASSKSRIAHGAALRSEGTILPLLL